MSLLLLPILLVLLYVLLILPQQRRVRAHQALVASLEVGDEVMTTSGIYGRLTAIDGDVLTLAVSPGVELRMARGAVGKRIEEPAEPADDGAAEGDGEADADDSPEPVTQETSEAEDR